MLLKKPNHEHPLTILEEEEEKRVWKEDKNGIYSIKLAYHVIKANIGGAKDVLFFEKMWVREAFPGRCNFLCG